MAQEKEPFLARWSRLKQEKPEEKEESKELAPPPQLPPVESLAPGSEEFKSFMHPQVEDALRRAALKKLFSDAHFNVPDPFEPYSGDWTGEALSPEMLATLKQADTLLFDKQHQPGPEEAKLEEADPERKPEERSAEKKTDEPGRQDA